MLLGLLPAAEAAGFHFVRAEAIGGVTDAGAPEGGVGASAISDAVRAWVTFGSPAVDNHVVRGWRLAGNEDGPTLGLVPPTFRGLVRPRDVPFAFPWVHGHLGGDALAQKLVEADVAAHYVLNVPGFWNVDPHRAHLGPTAGLGLNGTWWEGWRSAPEGVVMTGKLTGEAGFVAGITVRDTWYAQGRAVGRLDLFGVHQTHLDAAAVTGVYLGRAGVPLGLELRAALDRGTDTVTVAPATRWSVHAALFWKFTPPFQTKIEEDLERRRKAAAAR